MIVEAPERIERVDARARPLSESLRCWILTCALSWSLWGLMIASARGWIPARISINPLGSFGPAIAALLLASRRRGESRDLLRSALQHRFGGRMWSVVICGPLVLVGLAVGIAAALAGASLSPQGAGRAWLLPGLFLLILVIGGPLGEEPGWRGYILPRLLRVTNPIAASLVIGVMWLVWHAPLFWVPGSAQAGGSIILFAAQVLCFAVIFTWVYVRSSGSLLAVILLHTGINVWSFIVPGSFPTVASSPQFERVLLLLAVLLALAAAWHLRKIRALVSRG